MIEIQESGTHTHVLLDVVVRCVDEKTPKYCVFLQNIG
jgi:hypothetical protein